MIENAHVVYRVVVPGPPAPWSVYIRRRGAPSKSFLAMKDYQQRVQIAVLEQVGRINLLGPIWLEMYFYCPHPARSPKTSDKWVSWLLKNSPLKWDLRNLEKAAEDACQGLLYVNDSQVVRSTGIKEYDAVDPAGHTVIRVGRMEA